MISDKKINELQYCRNCLNSVYQLNLQRKDVLIYAYPQYCKRCLQSKNVVAHIRMRSRWKLLKRLDAVISLHETEHEYRKEEV